MIKYSDFHTSTKVILKVFGIILGLWFLWLIRDVALVLLVSIVLASAMEPLVDYLKLKKIPRFVTVLLVYILVLGLFGLVIALVTPPLVVQAKLALYNLPEYLNRLQAQFPFLVNVNLGDIAGSYFNGEDNSVITRTLSVFSGVVSFLTILVVSFYLVAEERGMKKLVASLVPSEYEDTAVHLVTRIQHKMGLWVLGQILLSVCIFVGVYLGLTLLGVQYALVLALLAGVFEVVPFIGPTLSAIPALFIAFSQSPALALAVLVLYIAVQKLESWILVPKIMQKTVGTSPVVIIFALLIGVKLGGVVGLLLAVPIVAIFTVLKEEWKI